MSLEIFEQEEAQKFRTFTSRYYPTEEWSEVYEMWLPIEVKKKLERKLHHRWEY